MIEYKVQGLERLEGSLYEEHRQYADLIKTTVEKLNILAERPHDAETEHAALIEILHEIIGSLEQIRRNIFYLQRSEMSNYLAGGVKAFSLDHIQQIDAKKFGEVNTEVLDELKEMQARSKVNYVQILKLLSLYMVQSVMRVEFICDYKIINNETLLDVEYPDHLIPNEFRCATLMTIMSDPCDITKTVTVDRALIIKLKQQGQPNPFTKEPWPDHIKTNADLQSTINLFVRKIEWLYLAFQKDITYKVLYENSAIQDLLQDRTVSYADFADRVNQFVLENPAIASGAQIATSAPHSTSLVAFRLNVAYPPKYIFDMFLDYGMAVTLHPKKQDYEKLIRRLTAAGAHKQLEILLQSPILDFVKVDIYACNEKDENALDLLQSRKVKYPNLVGEYDKCEAVLRKQQEPTALDIPSSTRWLRKTAAYYLPSFSINRASGFAALFALAAGTKGVCDYFNNRTNDTAIRPGIN